MSKIWTFYYYGWYGKGDSSDDIDYDAEVSDDEYNFLVKVDEYQDGSLEDEDFDFDAFCSENSSIMEGLEERIQAEVEECEAENFDDEEDMPSIVVRWPWE